MSATDRNRGERGSALIAVMMFAASVSALCLFTLTSSTSTYTAARSRLESTKAFYVAEGGVDMLLGNLKRDHWWPARNATLFPTMASDGTFESSWVSMGARGGEFKLFVTFQSANNVPSTWTSPGFPPGFAPFTNVTFENRATSTPSFSRVRARAIGRYNGTTRSVDTGIQFRTTLYGAAIVSDAAPISGAASGKSLAIDKDAIVMDSYHNYVHGGIKANNGVYLTSTLAPISDANVSTLLAGFTGNVSANLYGTEAEIPDFTAPGTATQLFDFNRFKAAAQAGAGHVYPNLTSFAAACRNANRDGTPLQGIIYVTIDAAAEGSSPHITTDDTSTVKMGNVIAGTGPDGINIEGTLVFHFENTSDRFYKVFGETPIRINPAPNDGTFDPADPTTFKTGYPPSLPAAAMPSTYDITGSGFANFSPSDDLPALMFDNGTVDIHYEANICGAVYSPSYMEIENKKNTRQFINGSIISGGGVYFEGGSYEATQIVNFDPSTVDSLATYDMRASEPTTVHFAFGN